MTICGLIFVSWFRVKKSGHDLIPKSQFGFEKWTKINVQNWKPEKSFEKDPLVHHLRPLCSRNLSVCEKMCYDNFFGEKSLPQNPLPICQHCQRILRNTFWRITMWRYMVTNISGLNIVCDDYAFVNILSTFCQRNFSVKIKCKSNWLPNMTPGVHN